MSIKLLTPNQHDELLNLYRLFPELTLENKGYEGINRCDFTQEAKDADKKVNSILKNSISGFSSFQNFCHSKAGEICLRFQYNYSYDTNDLPFTGVGYILLDELLNGFSDKTQKS
jgi:hypothetical protein